MKKSKEQHQLKASNAAHKALQNRNAKCYAREKQDKYQQKEMYHGACIVRQEKLGRVLTHAERKKVFDDVIGAFW